MHTLVYRQSLLYHGSSAETSVCSLLYRILEQCLHVGVPRNTLCGMGHPPVSLGGTWTTALGVNLNVYRQGPPTAGCPRPKPPVTYTGWAQRGCGIRERSDIPRLRSNDSK